MGALISFPVQIPPLPADSQDDMKSLGPAEKQWITEEIGLHIDRAKAELLDAIKPHGWRKFTFWLREWGLAAWALGIPITLVGLLITAAIFAANGIKDNAKFQTHTEDRLDHIEATLREMQATQSPSKVLKELTTLDTKQLSQSLPALQKITEQPTNKVNASPGALKDVAFKLKSVGEGSEDYWPAVLSFIQFASTTFSNNAPPPGSPVNFEWEDISGASAAKGVYLLKGDIGNTVFTDSRIIFTEQPVYFHNVRFVNCAFELPVTANPSPSLKQTSRDLLNAGIQSATLSETHS